MAVSHPKAPVAAPWSLALLQQNPPSGYGWSSWWWIWIVIAFLVLLLVWFGAGRWGWPGPRKPPEGPPSAR